MKIIFYVSGFIVGWLALMSLADTAEMKDIGLTLVSISWVFFWGSYCYLNNNR